MRNFSNMSGYSKGGVLIATTTLRRKQGPRNRGMRLVRSVKSWLTMCWGGRDKVDDEERRRVSMESEGLLDEDDDSEYEYDSEYDSDEDERVLNVGELDRKSQEHDKKLLTKGWRTKKSFVPKHAAKSFLRTVTGRSQRRSGDEVRAD